MGSFGIVYCINRLIVMFNLNFNENLTDFCRFIYQKFTSIFTFLCYDEIAKGCKVKSLLYIKTVCIWIGAFCLVALPLLSLASIDDGGGRVADISITQAPDFYSSSKSSPNDPDFNKQWAISKIRAPEAWQVTSGDEHVVIAILDTGIALNHDDLAGKVLDEANFSDSPTSYDIYGHGTHIAGIIAATANNGIGITGLAYNCRLLNVKVADESGRFDNSALAQSIIWAVDHGARVINMSLFAAKPSSELEEAVNYAWNKGAVLVCAAGNKTDTKPTYPAYYANCIAVAATDDDDSIASWSGHGDWVHVAAPGTNIYSTLPFKEYGYRSGTSMATAYVSGLAGLLFTLLEDENGDGFINDEVRMTIESSLDRPDSVGNGTGRINAFAAVNQIYEVE